MFSRLSPRMALFLRISNPSVLNYYITYSDITSYVNGAIVTRSTHVTTTHNAFLLIPKFAIVVFGVHYEPLNSKCCGICIVLL